MGTPTGKTVRRTTTPSIPSRKDGVCPASAAEVVSRSTPVKNTYRQFGEHMLLVPPDITASRSLGTDYRDCMVVVVALVVPTMAGGGML